MKQAAETTTHSSSADRPKVLGAIGMDLLDTAWRIALPVLGAAIIGIVLDRRLGTAPWITLSLAFAGLFVAGLLVKRQLAALEKEDRL